MSIKFIRNTDDATIVCKIPSDKNKSFVFRTKKVDRKNNVILSNGFTEITEDEIALLRSESKTFTFYEAKGRLTVMDNLPLDSMSSEQLISSLRAENAALKKQVIEVAKASTVVDSAEMKRLVESQAVEIKNLTEQLSEAKELPKKIEELQDKLSIQDEEHQREISDMQDVIDGLTEQLTEKSDIPEGTA
jgi:hypothetical protein